MQSKANITKRICAASNEFNKHPLLNLLEILVIKFRLEIRAAIIYEPRDPKIERTPKFWSIKYRVSQNEKDPQFLTNQKSKLSKKQKQSEAPNNRYSTIKSWEIEHQKPSNGRSKRTKHTKPII